MPCLWIDLHRMAVSILYLACFFCTHISDMWIQEVRVLRVRVGMSVCIPICPFLHTHFRDVHPRSERSWVCGGYYLYVYLYVCLYVRLIL